MKKTITLFAATTALTAAIGASAWSGMRATGDPLVLPVAAAFGIGADAMPLVLARSDDDDDHDYRSGERDDDDEDDCDDDDDDDEGDDACGDNTRNAVPAGSVAPPQNGLFGNGAPPKVQMN